MILLDHNATTPAPGPVLAAVLAELHAGHANASSTHGPGQAARRRLEQARARVAAFIGAEPRELVFTSGATESNQIALRGAVARATPARRRLVLSAIEHAAHLAAARRLRQQGWRVDLIPVDAEGVLDLAAARRLIGTDVALVSVMAANNETGVMQPIAELAQICREAAAPLHVDATQALGKCRFFLRAPAWAGVDLASAAAHKIGGPPGVGLLYLRRGVEWPALFDGRQERGRRAGTENGPGVAGFAAACDDAGATLDADLARMARLRDRLESALVRELGAVVLGGGAARVANTLALRFPGVPAEAALVRLEAAGVIASAGAACHAGSSAPSHVAQAMGLAGAAALELVRFSLSRHHTEPEIDAAIAAIVMALAPLREAAPA